MVVLTVLLTPPVLLALVPGTPGAVRVAGISLVWWYAALVGPALAAAVATALLVRSPE